MCTLLITGYSRQQTARETRLAIYTMWVFFLIPWDVIANERQKTKVKLNSVFNLDFDIFFCISHPKWEEKKSENKVNAKLVYTVA